MNAGPVQALPLRVLQLEDNLLDAELVGETVASAGRACEFARADDAEGFEKLLRGFEPDLILADYSLPTFDGSRALALARDLRPHTPFLFVSGAIGEERAIELLKAGATDYVLKHRLDRLAPAVDRALAEQLERVRRQALEQELRERAEQLAERDRHKHEFLAMLAHELRNPLAPIRNAVGILRAAGPADSSLAMARDVIDRQVTHLTRLVDDLLDMSRVIRGRINFQMRDADLAEVVTAAVETARPRVEQAGHQLTVRLPDGPVRLRGDVTRLAQALANILDNAAKYTDAGGRIDLTAGEVANLAVLSVRDTGIGISAELLPQVFELFTQAERGLARSQGGLGIGLTLAKRLVEVHGGTVEARSDGPGRGSEFLIRLPLAGEPQAAVVAEPVTPDAAGERPPLRRLVVVDDNVDAALTLSKLLEMWGHTVHVAHDGPAALRLARGVAPDLVVLDIGLPGMDGWELARLLLSEPTLRGVELVALTGYGQDSDRQRSAEAGISHHLVKPLDTEALESILARNHPTEGGPSRSLQ